MGTAGLNGFGAALNWNTQGKYVTACANDGNKGMLNGMLWIFNMGTFVSGNLMAAFLITGMSETIFYVVMTMCTVVTIFYFMFLP
jgi:hypothetical protein